MWRGGGGACGGGCQVPGAYLMFGTLTGREERERLSGQKKS